VKLDLLGFTLGNQLVDSVEHLLVQDATGHTFAASNSSVDFDALLTHSETGIRGARLLT
jgi:hypothetical protein